MSAERIGILGVDLALAGLRLSGQWDTSWRLDDMDRQVTRVEELLEGSGLTGDPL